MVLLKNKNIRNLLLLFFGICGIIWFFYSYPLHHPHSSVNFEYPKEDIIEKADSVFKSWQYQSNNFGSRGTFSSSALVIDSLQKRWTTKEFQQNLNSDNFPYKQLLYKWNIQKQNYQDEENIIEVRFGMSTAGEVINFNVSPLYIKNHRPFNRQAVRHVFGDQVENFSRDLEDSLIAGLVDYQHLSSSNTSNSRALQLKAKLDRLRGSLTDEVYNSNNIWKLADFYLDKMIWRDYELQRDSTKLVDERGITFARAFLSDTDTLSGLTLNLVVDLLPAGSLKEVSVDIQPEVKSAEEAEDILSTLSLLVVLSFGLWLFVIFYLRIKVHAIDTKPAMVVAVIAGFIAPAYLVLYFLQSAFIFIDEISPSDIINSLMIMGLFGAISAVIFFILTAVSDSITRQYWPKKLKTWDLIRRGNFKNKPVGWVIIHAFSIGGIIAGIWSSKVYFLPNMYVKSGFQLVSDAYVLSSVASLLASSFIVLLVVVTAYLIIANHVVGLTGRKWLIPIISGLIFLLFDVVPESLGPSYLEAITCFSTGFILGLFYIKFDFLTIALALFVFLNLILTVPGWLISNSPDANAFYLFVFLSFVLITLAIYFVTKGTERENIPEYIPAYIEEQAKEQRLKQELSIARVVQQTFLPSKIHHLPGIDIAGICIPAQETGGDYYDMIPLGESRTAIAIGDVSGKGIRAAFYMTFTKGVLHSLSPLIFSPVELLNQLNRLFNENATRGTFISMIYGILEADKRQFTFARAGHNPMLVVRKNGDVEWLQPKGLGIGVAKGDSFIKCTEESVLKLKEGDVAILYTDGITEMLSTGNQFYGEERLERLVKGVRKASSSKILEIIVDDVNEFKGVEKQHDDMTLVIIKADASVNQ